VQAHLHKVQLKHKLHRLPDLRFEAVELEAVALEDRLGTGSDADVAKDRRNLSGVYRGRGHKDVEGDGEEPEGGDVELAGLRENKHQHLSEEGGKKGTTTHQSHNRPNRPLDVHAVISVHRDQARLTTDRREIDEGPVIVHDLLEVLETVREHPVEFAREDGRVAGDDALALKVEVCVRTIERATGNQEREESETNLVQRNLEQHVPRPLHPKELARDEDQVLLRQQAHVLLPENAGKRRGEVDVGGGFFLDRLNDAALAAGDDVVELVVDFADFGVEAGLAQGREGQFRLCEV
jgi:hypothetical protein